MEMRNSFWYKKEIQNTNKINTVNIKKLDYEVN